ncbi:MAG: hypothetical protein AAFX06_14430 [Planctomycetota bacterium]
MPKKIALDYDANELRIVVANCSPGRVVVTDASVIPLQEGETASQKLRAFINENSLQKNETLVAIGRGKAELRELQLPPVPEEELPDMVRFQAIRNFASASDRAIVDFLLTRRTSDANTLIAAAVSPSDLDEIRELCGTSDLLPKRVALRPLTAASMYLRREKPKNICVLIDLLSTDAEIVVARDGKVIFVRTVRLPTGDEQRSRAIATELKRTMVACGESATPERIVVWGRPEVHARDVEAIRESNGAEDVRAVDPFSLVQVQMDASKLPEHSGRLAPLVGLLASDETAPETLIDFLNPRERPEEKPNYARTGLMIGGPIAALLLVGFFAYRESSKWDTKIANVTDEVNQLTPGAESAEESIARTEQIDQFLDSDVNWLDELKRFSEKAPSSDKMIVDSILAVADIRRGGGQLKVNGRVTDPGIIEPMEESLRDETHRITGKGSSEQKNERTYRWGYSETIGVTGPDIRNTRYERMALIEEAATSEVEASEPEDETNVEVAEVAEKENTDTLTADSEAPKSDDATSAPSESNAETAVTADEDAKPEDETPAAETEASA